MIVTILVNWGLGRILIKQEGIRKKAVLVIALIFDLGVIGYYKYFGFLVSILNSLLGNEVIADPEIRLPIGISFSPFRQFLISLIYTGRCGRISEVNEYGVVYFLFPTVNCGTYCEI